MSVYYPKKFVNPISNVFNSLGFVVLDGGLATQLESHGADLKDRLWSAKLLIGKLGIGMAVLTF
jgi:S-methylmethionine-dependent homocysteine/selenocysteine methylase